MFFYLSIHQKISKTVNHYINTYSKTVIFICRVRDYAILSMLNKRHFRFGREFQLSVRPSGRDFYVENISALEANFGWQEA